MADPTTMSDTAEKILRRVGAVPPIHAIPGVDELIEGLEALRRRPPSLITAERIGTSRLGEPIWLYHLGSGRRSALVVGGVHPNEPIGSLTILHLVAQLVEDAAFLDECDTTWHILPCADPDGMRLNEGWFAHPADRATYARQFFRPAPDEQVEWTFPFAYKSAFFDAMMPETQALAQAIDDTHPDLYVPLHNSEGGGAYFYLSRPVPALYPLLHEVTAGCGVPLHTGEAEGAHYRVLADAVYEMGTLQDAYDWTEAAGLDPYPPGSAGDASTSYASRHGTLSMIAEVPQFVDPSADDATVTDVSHRAALRRCGEHLVEAGTLLTKLIARVEAEALIDTPLMRAARTFAPLALAAGHADLTRSETMDDRRATISELTSFRSTVHLHRLRWGGMLRRALCEEVDAGVASETVRQAAVEIQQLFDGWLRESLDDAAGDPPRLERAVRAQLGALLAAHAQLGTG